MEVGLRDVPKTIVVGSDGYRCKTMLDTLGSGSAIADKQAADHNAYVGSY